MKKRLFLCLFGLLTCFVPLSGACGRLCNFDVFAELGWSPEALNLNHALQIQQPMDVPVDAYRPFFATFLLHESVVQEMCALASVLNIDAHDTASLLRLVFSRFSLAGEPLDQAVQRALELRQAGVASFDAFVRALYEGVGFTPVVSSARVSYLTTWATLYHDLEKAFWVDLFELRGFSEDEAMHAYSVMQDRLRVGDSHWHAFSWALFTLLGFDRVTIEALVHYQEHWVLQGADSDLAFYHALYYGFGFIDPQVQEDAVCRLQYHLSRREPLVTAYFRVRLEYTDLTGHEIDHVLNRLRDILASDTEEPIRNNAYFIALYEGFGFPRSLAETMAELSRNMFLEQGPHVDCFRIFWSAAFIAMGLRGEQFDAVYAIWLEYLRQGYRAREAFERTCWQWIAMPAGVNGVEEVFPSGDLNFYFGQERFRYFLFRCWKSRYPYVSDETLRDAVQGFLDSPSGLTGILRVLSAGIDGVFQVVD